MSSNLVGTPKFYIDAILLARQWGMVYDLNSNAINFFHLNPANITDLNIPIDGKDYISLYFRKRYFLNSLSHYFVLGHNFNTDNISHRIFGYAQPDGSHIFSDRAIPSLNGWKKYNLGTGDDPTGNIETSMDLTRLVIEITGTGDTTTKLGEISAGWSYSMPHSPDLELTLNFDNESIKTQTTKGGHTLSNAGWNHQPVWNRKAAWVKGAGDSESDDFDHYRIYPSGRRSWNLKFSYLDKTDMFSENFFHNDEEHYGIFNFTSSGFSVKEDWLNSVWFSTNCGQLPFIFQPNQSEEEYAICRFSGTPSFKQVANGVYDISLDIVETW